MIGVVAARFNEEVTGRLLQSCLKTLKAHKVPDSALRVVRVPGSYEIPWAVQELALSGRFDVVIALGAVIRGSTPQNDHISRSTIQSLHRVALATRVPVILGVLTPNTHRQAMERTRGSLDRGKEAALAALQMADLREEFRTGGFSSGPA